MSLVARRSSLTLIASVPIAVAIAACGPDSAPISNITVSGPTGTTHLNSSASGATYTWAEDRLIPPAGDPNASVENITWNPSPAESRYELVAFDMPYFLPGGKNGWLGLADSCHDPQFPGVDCYAIVADSWGQSVDYVALNGALGNQSRDFKMKTPIAHRVHYWHGQCAIVIKWSDVFAYVSNRVMPQAASCGVKWTQACLNLKLPDWIAPTVSATRSYERYEPHFSSDVSTQQWGFSVESEIVAEAGLWDVTIDVHPAFTVGRDPSTGLVQAGLVNNVGPQVIVIGDPTNGSVKKSIEKTVQDASRKVVRTLQNALDVPINAYCTTADQSIDAQQAECYDSATQSGTGGTVEDYLLGLALLSKVGSIPLAKQLAGIAFEAVQPHDFTCGVNGAGVQQCYFHPYVYQVNVLPNVVELVTATEEEAGTSTLSPSHILTMLINTALTSSAAASLPFPVTATCDSYNHDSNQGTVAGSYFDAQAIPHEPPLGSDQCPPLPTTVCYDGECADLQTDRDHCGECGTGVHRRPTA